MRSGATSTVERDAARRFAILGDEQTILHRAREHPALARGLLQGDDSVTVELAVRLRELVETT